MSELMPTDDRPQDVELVETDRRSKGSVPPRHARRRRFRPTGAILGFVAASLAVVLVSTSAVAAVVANTFAQALDDAVLVIDDTPQPAPDIGAMEGGFNMLIVGSDEASDGGFYSDRPGGARNDVTILLHIAQDQKSAVAISFPRDMTVPVPECARYWGYSAQINAVGNSGLSCVVQTVRDFTGLTINYAAMVNFGGVINLSDAIGGVDVCFTGPVYDPYTGLRIRKAGTQTLKGWSALAFLRSRYQSVTGSANDRVNTQAIFLASLVRKVKDDGTLEDMTKLFSLAQAALQEVQRKNLTLTSGLTDATTLVSLALTLKDLPTERFVFVQYPVYQPGGTGTNWMPNTSVGNVLLSYVKKDQPFKVGSLGITVAKDPNAPAVESEVDNSKLPTINGLQGQSASTYTCADF